MRNSVIVALAFLLGACANKKENFDTLSVRKYLDSSLATVNEEKRYASLYPRALEPHASNTVRLHPETAGQELYSRSMPVGTVLWMISHGRRPAWPVIPLGRMENVQGLQSWFRSIGLT